MIVYQLIYDTDDLGAEVHYTAEALTEAVFHLLGSYLPSNLNEAGEKMRDALYAFRKLRYEDPKWHTTLTELSAEILEDEDGRFKISEVDLGLTSHPAILKWLANARSVMTTQAQHDALDALP